MSRLKYIITQKGHFALFSDVSGTSHAHVGRLMADSDDKVTGGGFATLNHQEGPVVVYGNSVSAKVESSDDHAEAIIKSIEAGEAFQLLAGESLIGFCEQWILTNSEELERALLQKVRSHNVDYPGREPLEEPKKETLSLNDLKSESVENRYHVPDPFFA